MALRALAKASSPVSRWADAGAATALETPAATKRFNRSGRLCMWYSPRLSVWDWCLDRDIPGASRSEEHTSELPSLMRISYAVFCLKKKKETQAQTQNDPRQPITTHTKY